MDAIRDLRFRLKDIQMPNLSKVINENNTNTKKSKKIETSKANSEKKRKINPANALHLDASIPNKRKLETI